MYTKNIEKQNITINNKKIYIGTDKVARYTASSVLAEYEGTTLLVTIVYKDCEEKDFLPLKVDYLERYYASGRIPGNYFKREGKPSEREILIGRLIDRSIRNSFPKNLGKEIQITITVLSMNTEIDTDMLAIISTSIALNNSELPFEPVAAIKIAYNDKYIINPTSNEEKNSKLSISIAGNENKIFMIESNSNEVDEKILLEAIFIAKKEIPEILEQINKFKKDKINIVKTNTNDIDLIDYIESNYSNKLHDVYKIESKIDRKKCISELKDTIYNDSLKRDEKINNQNINGIIDSIENKIIIDKIFNDKIRLDGRKLNEVRNINIDINFLSNTHGSALFTRGETQAIVSITLGTQKDAQSVDCVFNTNQKHNFILHYNFPPYCVNEIGNAGLVKRREIGHGNLAKKALYPILPSIENFPYVIRIVSEITESNGSSSMATVCGGSLALMDAGIPVANHVAGIAIFLIIRNNNEYIILTDISGEEDHIGNMDFKLSRTINGITALQMDTKNDGIDFNIMENILYNAKQGVLKILDIMNKSIEKPKNKLSNLVPKVNKIKIDKSKIKNLIGKNGTTIRMLTDKYNCKIDVDNEGQVLIFSNNNSSPELLINEITSITDTLKVGMIFKGKIVKLTKFGAFINLSNRTDGLLHISKYPQNEKIEIKEGNELEVIISSINDNGKINLNIK